MSRTEGQARSEAVALLALSFRPNATKEQLSLLGKLLSEIPTMELRQAIYATIQEEESLVNPVAAVTKRASVLVAERKRRERAEEMNRRHREQKRIGDDVPLDTSWRGKAQSISDLARSLAGEMTVDSPDAADGREER